MELWELVAREQVRQNYAAYHHAGDRFRLDEVAACFAPQGTLVIKGSTPATGRHAIIEMLSGARDPEARSASEAPVVQIRHFMTNLAFTRVEPEAIESSAYFCVFTQRGPDHWGRYRDRLVPEGDRWVFAHRLVAVDSAIPGGWYADIGS